MNTNTLYSSFLFKQGLRKSSFFAWIKNHTLIKYCSDHSFILKSEILLNQKSCFNRTCLNRKTTVLQIPTFPISSGGPAMSKHGFTIWYFVMFNTISTRQGYFLPLWYYITWQNLAGTGFKYPRIGRVNDFVADNQPPYSGNCRQIPLPNYTLLCGEFWNRIGTWHLSPLFSEVLIVYLFATWR